ncbi:Metal-dependent hydrolase [Desulfosporosinus sp. I2]|nr:Metal-dependent hydrolase [Desulfosporosinus sp. I2]
MSGVPIDLAIMGIGAYSPKSFEARHATPEQAWKMAEEISAKWIIPMHWGAFNLSGEPMEEPIARSVSGSRTNGKGCYPRNRGYLDTTKLMFIERRAKNEDFIHPHFCFFNNK